MIAQMIDWFELQEMAMASADPKLIPAVVACDCADIHSSMRIDELLQP
jgi:hypothetical protein